ncbi:MAG: hypothetical protein JWP63_6785 [Candidatus Solibacter sp.]|jgi:hypothetical protein|nr:hypothetical protein [Candidatus Solibacter sp.]
MPRLVLKANQIDADAVVAERRFAGILQRGFTALSRIVALKPSPLLQRSHLSVRRPLLPGVLVFSEAGADTQTELMIPPPAYNKGRGSGRFRFSRQLWNVQQHAKESR